MEIGGEILHERKQKLDSGVEREVRRRILDRGCWRSRIEDNDEHARTRDSTRGTGSHVAKTCTTSANHGAAWAYLANVGGCL